MGFYDEMQELATGLLTEFNQGKISYIEVVQGNGPADNPGPSTQMPHVLTGATATGVSKKYVDSGLAVVSDLQVKANVDPSFTPNNAGLIKIQKNDADPGITYKILGVFPTPAAGTAVVYTYVIHKGQ